MLRGGQKTGHILWVCSVFFFFPPSINQGDEPAIAPIRVEGAEQRNKRSRNTCDMCDKVIIGDLEWIGEAFDLQYNTLNCYLLIKMCNLTAVNSFRILKVLGSQCLKPASFLKFLVSDTVNISPGWKRFRLTDCLCLQLIWSPKSITITWGRRGGPTLPVMSRSIPLPWRQRTLATPLRGLLKTQGLLTKKYPWHFKNRLY